jgi:hypothetical protein
MMSRLALPVSCRVRPRLEPPTPGSSRARLDMQHDQSVEKALVEALSGRLRLTWGTSIIIFKKPIIQSNLIAVYLAVHTHKRPKIEHKKRENCKRDMEKGVENEGT